MQRQGYIRYEKGGGTLKPMNILNAFLKSLGCIMICVVLSLLLYPFLGSQDVWIVVSLIIVSAFAIFTCLFTLLNRSKMDDHEKKQRGADLQSQIVREPGK